MARARVDVVSIGTLSRNRLWNEADAVRTAHATTSLIRIELRKGATAGIRTLLVDPGLPGPVLAARFAERTGLPVSAVDAVFFTTLRGPQIGGASAFDHARFYAAEAEIDAARRDAAERAAHLDDQDVASDDPDRADLRAALRLLDRIKPAPDTLADGVDLFPLAGYSPGSAGLLVSGQTLTFLIAGPSVPTLDHFLAGQVLPECIDLKAAQESLAEVYEIADVVVPGFDNTFLNPRMQGA